MNKQEKTEALMTVVKAYIARGVRLQYDQRSMDRVIQLTPRRMRQLPPEAATTDFTLFLDCSSYMNSLIREAFGYILPSELTWNMIDLAEPRVFYRKFDMDEPIENVKCALSEMRSILEVGDIITFTRKNGNGRNGHTVMYIGDNKYTHLTTGGRPNSYDYENKRSREYETGVFVDDLTELLEDKILTRGGGIVRISVTRPLDIVGEPTQNTIARCTTARGLVAEVTSSHSYGKLAAVGDIVEYTVTVESTIENMAVSVKFTAPIGTSLIDSERKEIVVNKGEKKNLSFRVKLDTVLGYHIDGPSVNVNGLDVFTHRVPVGNMLCAAQTDKLNATIEKHIGNGTSTYDAIRGAYNEIGISMRDSAAECIRTLFAFHDAVCCDLLSRNEQKPEEDAALFSYFGGTHVTTPEMVSRYYIRTNKPKLSDLAAGDIILTSADALANETYCCYYTGDKLIGDFEDDASKKVFTREEAAAFVDSLIGRLCFVVLRPSQIKD